ncbi:hypothetical protein MOD67_14220 [Bacillus licheniformis]|uniref:hypothetical protein n=1 Tax=Bacillus TaxID=1386 RepID=UPI00228278A8|nr:MULTISPECIES: hypothetical protein [Bacillus]MCY7861178.1 hypothetical protein [Bacillus haynesii]MCY8015493.1 hypothetical protein [Bacillus haynesii]MCY8291492.1 hypothetical protein [Bacillus haynesii]MCY8549116.1 hypothetical protein [Bacillus haynesii]MCY8745136.1 hypothetical protein [Bacillus licheniformis]
MLPHTARIDDIVEVIDKNHDYFGRTGKIANIMLGKVVVNFNDREVGLHPSSLSLKARLGTRKHKELMEDMEGRQSKYLTWDDLNDLMNYALDLQDYEWAYELKQRRDS